MILVSKWSMNRHKIVEFRYENLCFSLKFVDRFICFLDGAARQRVRQVQQHRVRRRIRQRPSRKMVRRSVTLISLISFISFISFISLSDTSG